MQGMEWQNIKMPEQLVFKFTKYHALWLLRITFLRYALIITMLHDLKGKQVNCITEVETFLLLVKRAYFIWIWFNYSWKDSYKFLEWVFRLGSKSSCRHKSINVWGNRTGINGLIIFRNKQLQAGRNRLDMQHVWWKEVLHKKYCIILLFWNLKRGKQRGNIPAMLSKASNRALFLAEYKLGFTECKECHTKSDHLPIILLPAEAIRERNRGLTHSQKLWTKCDKQTAALKQIVKNNSWFIHKLSTCPYKMNCGMQCFFNSSLAAVLPLWWISQQNQLKADSINLNSNS